MCVYTRRFGSILENTIDNRTESIGSQKKNPNQLGFYQFSVILDRFESEHPSCDPSLFSSHVFFLHLSLTKQYSNISCKIQRGQLFVIKCFVKLLKIK